MWGRLPINTGYEHVYEFLCVVVTASSGKCETLVRSDGRIFSDLQGHTILLWLRAPGCLDFWLSHLFWPNLALQLINPMISGFLLSSRASVGGANSPKFEPHDRYKGLQAWENRSHPHMGAKVTCRVRYRMIAQPSEVCWSPFCFDVFCLKSYAQIDFVMGTLL